MNKVFIDTSGWASFFIEKNPYYVEALRLMRQWQQQNRHIVTTNYVLTELIALFTRERVQRSTALDYIENIRSADWVEICPYRRSVRRESMAIACRSIG